MKRLLLPLLASLALPTAVNAETLSLTKDQRFDLRSYGMFRGAMDAICNADKQGFLRKNEKLQMISFYTAIYKAMHKNKSTYNQSKNLVLSNVKDRYPNCLP